MSSYKEVLEKMKKEHKRVLDNQEETEKEKEEEEEEDKLLQKLTSGV